MKSVSASCHQGNVCLFGNNAGFQCTAVALAALIFASFCPVSDWRSSTVNDVLFYGDTLYSTAVRSNYGGHQVYLMPSDLPTNVRFLERDLEISSQIDEIHGMTTDSTGASDFLAVSLEHGLVLALSNNNYALLTIGQLTVAIIHDSIQDTYHLYDSHSRDGFGSPTSNGAAVLLTFGRLEKLCIYLQKTYRNQVYNLIPVSVTNLGSSIANSQSDLQGEKCSKVS